MALAAAEVAVFTETNIGTRLALTVPPIITAADFKRILEIEHFGCFPEAGAIRVHGVMVNLKSCFYHLPDSMPIQYAFLGTRGSWFLHADLVPSVECIAANNNQDATIPNKMVYEASSATTSSDVSVGGLINKYFTSSTETSNHSSQAVNSRAIQIRAKIKPKFSNSCRKPKLANSADFRVKTPPKRFSEKSKIGKRIVMASYSLGISPGRETVSSLRQSKSSKFKALRSDCSPIRCPVFEISGDSAD